MDSALPWKAAGQELDRQKTKWNVYLTEALRIFIRIITNRELGTDLVLERCTRFHGVMQKFPLYSCYIQSEILRISKAFISFPEKLELDKKKIKIFEQAFQEGEGELGEFVLQILLESIFTEAIAQWGSEVPAEVLANAARSKANLKKYEEARASLCKGHGQVRP